MNDALISYLLGAWGAVCGSSHEIGAIHHGFSGPLIGNVLVAGAAGLLTLLCFVVALRLLVHPGENDPSHPKYRVLRPDR